MAYKNIPLETPMEDFSNKSYDCASNHLIETEDLLISSQDHSGTLYSSYNNSTVSAIKPTDKNETLNNGTGSQSDNMYTFMHDISDQIKCISKTQKTAIDQLHLKIQNMIDQKLGAYQNNISNIIKNSNKVNKYHFTQFFIILLPFSMKKLITYEYIKFHICHK